VHLPKLLAMAQSRRSTLYQVLWKIDAGFSEVRDGMRGVPRIAGI
jgi:hypothetical protein